MKKLIAFLLVLVMMLGIVACAPAEQENADPTPSESQPAGDNPGADKPNPPESTAMTYEEYMAADLEAEVTVEFYVQATQGWWFNDDPEVNSGVITVYGQSAEGGYFAYEVRCDEETGNKLVPGTKIRLTGEKAVWDGEVEIMNSTVEILEGDPWIAETLDVTALLGTAELEEHMNKKISVKGATVEAANENGDVFLYKWNGAGAEGDDLYFKVSVNGQSYTFVVESYLCGLGSETYEAVRGLQVGDVIDLEGFLYWYNGAQPHITSVVKAAQ